MSSTVNDIITRFQRVYRDCDAAYGLTLFQDAHAKLMQRVQLRNSTKIIDLTANVREFDLGADVWRVHEAYYERSSDPGDWLVLLDRSTDEFIVKRRGWRTFNIGTGPTEYYITSAVDGDSAKNVVGFNPMPDTTTDVVTGYPRVRLYTTSLAVLSGSETVPSNILNDQVYIYMMAAAYAAERHDNEASKWIQLAEREIDLNVLHIKDMQSQSTTELFPTTFFTSRVR